MKSRRPGYRSGASRFLWGCATLAIGAGTGVSAAQVHFNDDAWLQTAAPSRAGVLDPNRYLRLAVRRASGPGKAECVEAATGYIVERRQAWSKAGINRVYYERTSSYLRDPQLLQAVADALACTRELARSLREQVEEAAAKPIIGRDFGAFASALDSLHADLLAHPGTANVAFLRQDLEYTARDRRDPGLAGRAAQLLAVAPEPTMVDVSRGIEPYLLGGPSYRAYKLAVVEFVGSGLDLPTLRALAKTLEPLSLAERGFRKPDFDVNDQGEYRRSLVRGGEDPVAEARTDPSIYKIYAMIAAEADPTTSRLALRAREARLQDLESRSVGREPAMNPRLPYELDRYASQWHLSSSANGPWCHAARPSPLAGDQGFSETIRTLFAVAQSKTILIFSHGQTIDRPGWNRTQAELENIWAPFVTTARHHEADTAYCLVNWNTDEGVGDQEGKVLQLMVILRMITDDPSTYSADRTLTLVGHSSGANYNRLNYFRYRHYPLASEAPTSGPREPTRTRVLSIGGPHIGTRWIETTRLLADLAEASPFRKSLELQASKALSRGAAQMVWQNPSLLALNQDIDALTPRAETFALVGGLDEVVAPESACLAAMQCQIVPGATHAGLMMPFGRPEVERFYLNVISGRPQP